MTMHKRKEQARIMRERIGLAALFVLLLSGCGVSGAVQTSANAENPPPSRTAPAAAEPVTTVPVSSPTPSQQAPQKPDPAPATEPVIQGGGAPGDTPGQAAPSSMAQAMNWRPAGIGLPLVSDHPAAKNVKVVMLSFDDGPTPAGHTAKVLDALKEHQVKAVFFITGNGLKHRDLVERIHREGHVLGVHTVSHANLTKLPATEMRKEIEPLVELIESVTGARPTLFRPPYGAYNDAVRAVLKEYGLELVNWTNSSKDWEHKEPAKVIDEVIQQLHRGAVVLLHDIKPHTAEALPEMLKRIRAEGYEFVVMK